MRLWTRVEPLLWLLFVAGGVAAALLLPAGSFALGIAYPAGWYGDAAESYARLRSLFGSLAVQLLVALLQSLVFWHAAHRLRHLLRTFGVEREAVACTGCYGLAVLASVATFVVWLRI
jgi:fumarate reductase subunit D